VKITNIYPLVSEAVVFDGWYKTKRYTDGSWCTVEGIPIVNGVDKLEDLYKKYKKS